MPYKRKQPTAYSYLLKGCTHCTPPLDKISLVSSLLSNLTDLTCFKLNSHALKYDYEIHKN